ncbi:hypothetical protein [Thermobifida halotolerans]|uniref:hypothetical protein n=1 Tax=Thermobifida halotolerans TaxID=483545 RepID=UPI0018FE0D74|nr:hypothetical protein [Thermobifida halotolerans]
MGMHVFVDETKNRGYLVAAAVILPPDVTATRRTVNGLCRSGQRRIHFTKENDARRRQIITAMTGLKARVEIYDASDHHPRDARTRCLEAITEDLAGRGRVRLVLERDDSVLNHDKRVLYERVRKFGATELEYVFMRAHEECLLAIPDAVAWCWAKGGSWRSAVESMVDQTHRL